MRRKLNRCQSRVQRRRWLSLWWTKTSHTCSLFRGLSRKPKRGSTMEKWFSILSRASKISFKWSRRSLILSDCLSRVWNPLIAHTSKISCSTIRITALILFNWYYLNWETGLMKAGTCMRLSNRCMHRRETNYAESDGRKLSNPGNWLLTKPKSWATTAMNYRRPRRLAVTVAISTRYYTIPG